MVCSIKLVCFVNCAWNKRKKKSLFITCWLMHFSNTISYRNVVHIALAHVQVVPYLHSLFYLCNSFLWIFLLFFGRLPYALNTTYSCWLNWYDDVRIKTVFFQWSRKGNEILLLSPFLFTTQEAQCKQKRKNVMKSSKKNWIKTNRINWAIIVYEM